MLPLLILAIVINIGEINDEICISFKSRIMKPENLNLTLVSGRDYVCMYVGRQRGFFLPTKRLLLSSRDTKPKMENR